jgi:hypothetical protein
VKHVRATEYAKTWRRELPIAGDTWTMCSVAPAPQTFRGHASPRLSRGPSIPIAEVGMVGFLLVRGVKSSLPADRGPVAADRVPIAASV